MKANITDKKIEIELHELFTELEYDESGAAEAIVEWMAWLPQIRKIIITQLKEQWSRPCYNEDIHKERQELLHAMQAETIKYYADEIASKIEEWKRNDKIYFTVWHWLCDHNMSPGAMGYPHTPEIDFDYRKELEKVIIEAMQKKLPQPGEGEK